jgi:hypothetical protein
MDNSGKIILDLCGGTGSWSRPYRDAGYDVRVITLPDNDVLTYDPPENVYGVLAAPPCQMFSICRTNTAKKPRDIDGSLKIVTACQRIILQCKPVFWAMENPLGMLRKLIGRPKFTFQPYEFGDRYSKKTDLWGYYNEPKKTPVKLTDEEINYQRKHHVHKYPAAKEMPGFSREARRAITPQGFAQAFFKANR